MPHDDQSELFYLVDENDKVLGSIKRKDAHSDKTQIHRAVDIILTNPKHQTLLQKRSQHKDKLPGYWTVAASGHVTYGQTYRQAARSELQEELGITTKLRRVTKYLGKMSSETEYLVVYTGKIDYTPTETDAIEIDKIKWVDINKLSDFAKNNNLTPMSIVAFQILGFLPKS